MVEKIPSTFTVKEMDSFAALFETWHTEHHRQMKTERRQKITTWIRKYLGWITAIAALIKPVVDAFLTLKNTIYP